MNLHSAERLNVSRLSTEKSMLRCCWPCFVSTSRHVTRRPQAEVDSTMRRFEQEEAAEAAERKTLRENPEDDDGFVTVTYKRKRGRNNNPSADASVDEATRSAKKKQKGAGELTDFYRFQVGVAYMRCFGERVAFRGWVGGDTVCGCQHGA